MPNFFPFLLYLRQQLSTQVSWWALDWTSGLRSACQRSMGLEAIHRVLPLPTGTAEVFETLEVPAEVRAHHPVAHGAEGVLQVRVDLYLNRAHPRWLTWQDLFFKHNAYLFCEFGGFNVHKACFHCLHETSLVSKCYSARSNWIFEAIGVNSSIDYTSKQVIHNVCKTVCWQKHNEHTSQVEWLPHTHK